MPTHTLSVSHSLNSNPTKNPKLFVLVKKPQNVCIFYDIAEMITNSKVAIKEPLKNLLGYFQFTIYTYLRWHYPGFQHKNKKSQSYLFIKSPTYNKLQGRPFSPI